MSTLIAMWRAAIADPAAVAGAREAFALFQSYCSAPQPRIPGMGTLDRLAVRIHRGATAEAAAAREYSYRWHLALNQWINHVEARSRSKPITGAWAVPHLIGM